MGAAEKSREIRLGPPIDLGQRRLTKHSSVIVPDTGKRGVQSVGTVKPHPPRRTPLLVHAQKDG